SDQTHDRIPQILPYGSVDRHTRLVLVNALYLKAPWQTPFDELSTKNGPFHRADGTVVRVPMMTADPEAALRSLLDDGLAGPGSPGLALTMPRWTYRVATDLVEPLEKLGMERAFGPQADFSAMTTDDALEVSDVLHQTFIAVDEAGTE